MVRISVPGLPQALLSTPPAPAIPLAIAVERIATFLSGGNTALITGAGVSVDSGIRAYRGKDGRYMNPNYEPILYHQLVDESPKGHAFRQRYWLRSYMGYPPVRDTLPNTSHYAIAALQHTSFVSRLVTQNVDGLHHKSLRDVWDEAKMKERILELHGTLHKVHCKHGHVVDRNEFQELLSAANPSWKEFMDDLERTGQQPRTNPDGDVAIEGVSYESFVVPNCPSCTLEGKINNVHKPEVIFFGESIAQAVKQKSFEDIERCNRLFVVGTTLSTYSAFRLLKHALELRKPILLLNVGPTRAEGLVGVEKIEMASGTVLREVVRALVGSRAQEDAVVRRMLQSGIVKPPDDDDDRAPRAAG